MFGLSSLYVKLIGGAIAALVVLGLALGLRHYRSLAESRGQTIATICQATRTASGQPKLKCGDVPQQIQFMGEAIGTLTTALNKQNAAVAAMGAETTRQQTDSAKASQEAAQRAKGAEGAVTRLNASSRSSERLSAPCAASAELQKGWK